MWKLDLYQHTSGWKMFSDKGRMSRLPFLYYLYSMSTDLRSRKILCLFTVPPIKLYIFINISPEVYFWFGTFWLALQLALLFKIWYSNWIHLHIGIWYRWGTERLFNLFIFSTVFIMNRVISKSGDNFNSTLSVKIKYLTEIHRSGQTRFGAALSYWLKDFSWIKQIKSENNLLTNNTKALIHNQFR